MAKRLFAERPYMTPSDSAGVECDTQGDSFIVALDIDSGETVWKTSRDELPS